MSKVILSLANLDVTLEKRSIIRSLSFEVHGSDSYHHWAQSGREDRALEDAVESCAVHRPSTMEPRSTSRICAAKNRSRPIDSLSRCEAHARSASSPIRDVKRKGGDHDHQSHGPLTSRIQSIVTEEAIIIPLFWSERAFSLANVYWRTGSETMFCCKMAAGGCVTVVCSVDHIRGISRTVPGLFRPAR